MTPQEEKNILERHIRGVNFRIIWALIVCTTVSVTTLLSIYYANENDKALIKRDYDHLKENFKELKEDVNELKEEIRKK